MRTKYKIDYDEISPITGEKTVLVENLDNETQSRLCMQSGYYNSSSYHKTNEKMEEIESNFPDIIRDSRIEDELGFYWYLSSMNLGMAMLYPEPDLEEKFLWCVMPVKMIEPMKFELDEPNAEYFGPSLFEEAFDKLYSIVAEQTGSL